MKAVVLHEYGSPDVLEVADVPKPALTDDTMLVRVRAASINPYDWHFLTGLPYVGRLQFGLRKPRVNGMGADLAGSVEAVGDEVTEFRPGEEVFGEVDGESPGKPVFELASLAEFVRVSPNSVARKPSNLTFQQAAAVPMAGQTALQALKDWANVQPGQHVLVNGASGGVGTFAVQIAKALGAEVTGVCSGRNAKMVLSIGADHVIDYTQEDFVEGGPRFDVMLDNVGNRSLSACRRVLTRKGTYVASFGQPEHKWLGPAMHLVKMTVISRLVGHTLIQREMRRAKADLETLAAMIEAGEVMPVVDRTYPLDEAAEAIRYLEAGHAGGKIVVTV